MILKYRVMALIGESGSGKDTLAKSVLSRDPKILYPVISCTTRERRENEQDGKDYYFLTPQEFCDKITQRDFIETTTFNGWMYGTPLSSLSLDKINIGVFNPDGIFSMLDNQQIDLYIAKLLDYLCEIYVHHIYAHLFLDYSLCRYFRLYANVYL